VLEQLNANAGKGKAKGREEERSQDPGGNPSRGSSRYDIPIAATKGEARVRVPDSHTGEGTRALGVTRLPERWAKDTEKGGRRSLSAAKQTLPKSREKGISVIHQLKKRGASITIAGCVSSPKGKYFCITIGFSRRGSRRSGGKRVKEYVHAAETSNIL